MKFIILLLILLLPLASALEFSPTSLEFNLEKNQQTCKDIFFRLDSQATVSDSWAQNQNDPWSVTQFQTSAETHKLTLNYQNDIVPEQRQIEVCLSGSKPGDYRGVLLFRQSEQGNSIVQFAIWLKVSISGTDEEPQPAPESKSNKKSRSSSSGGISEYVVVDNSKPKQEAQSLSFDLPEEKIKLNSKVSKTPQNNQLNLLPILAISFTAIIFIILLFLIIKK